MAKDFRIQYIESLFKLFSSGLIYGDFSKFKTACIEEIGKMIEVDAVFLFDNDKKNQKSKFVEKWIQPDIECPELKVLNLNYSEYPEIKEVMRNNDCFIIDDCSNAKGDIAKLCKLNSVKSLFAMPLFVSGKWHSNLVLANMCSKHKWTETELYIIKTFGYIMSSAYVRYQGILRKKKIESDLEATKNFLESIMNSTDKLIAASDLKGNMLYWNKGAEYITGVKKEQIINKNVYDSDLDFKKLYVKLLENKLFETGKSQKFEVTSNSPNLGSVTLSMSLSLLRDNAGNDIGIVCVGTDINPLSYMDEKPVAGNSYLLATDSSIISYNLLFNLSKKFNSTMIVTRNKKEAILARYPSENFNHFWLDSSDDLLENVEKKLIDNIKKNSVILLERADYLIGFFGFNEFLKLLYKINSKVYESRSILLISLSPKALDKKEQYFIEKELKQLMLIDKPSQTLSEELMQIIKFLSEKEAVGSDVSLQDISQKFSITRPTTHERIKKLEEMAFISTKKEGRRRLIILTSKGKLYLSNLE